MHRRPKAELLPQDIELERTMRNLKKVRIIKALVMAKREGTDQHIPAEPMTGRPQRQRTMEDFWRPIIKDNYSTVRQPAIEANNFDLKLALIIMVQQHQYTRHPSKDPNEHLERFLRKANIVKLNEVNPDVIKLHMFPFSLRNTTTSWFESLQYGSIKN